MHIKKGQRGLHKHSYASESALDKRFIVEVGGKGWLAVSSYSDLTEAFWDAVSRPDARVRIYDNFADEDISWYVIRRPNGALIDVAPTLSKAFDKTWWRSKESFIIGVAE